MLGIYWIPMIATFGCCVFVWSKTKDETIKDALLWLMLCSTIPIANVVGMGIAVMLVLATISLD